MENKTAFDILIETLDEMSYSVESSNTYKPIIVSGERFMSAKYVCCEIVDSIYFYASDSYSSKAFTSSTFTGLYSTIDLAANAEYKIYKKIGLMCSKEKKRKTGVDFIDRNVTLLTSGRIPTKELNRENIDLFLKMNDTGSPYSLIVENNYLPRINRLKDRKVIAIETQDWIYKKEELENLLALGSLLITNIKKICESGDLA